MRVARSIFLATAHAILSTILRQRIVTFASRLLHATTASQAARGEGAPGTPAPVHHFQRVTHARHTVALLAPVAIVVARGAICPGQITGVAHLVGMRVLVAEQTTAISLVGAVSAAITMDQLALLIQRVNLTG